MPDGPISSSWEIPPGEPPSFSNPLFLQADLRLVIGLIDPHQFVGYTGGVKGAAIGLAGAQTIEANHSMLFDPRPWSEKSRIIRSVRILKKSEG